MDEHQEQLRSITLPADPLPISNPRVEPFATDEAGSYTGALVGAPVGYTGIAQMPIVNDVLWAQPISLTSVIGLGTTVVSVTTAAPHNLSTNSQISVKGLSYNNANGAFSVVVTSATAFTYDTKLTIPSGSYLTSTTIMITVNIGLPYNTTTLPNGLGS
jgi:hypothetical protein